MLLPPEAASALASAVASLVAAVGAVLGPSAAPLLPAGADSPAAPAGPSAAASAWTPPVEGLLLVLEPFAPPAATWLPGHRGVDLAAPAGTAVLAAGGGIVVFAGPVAGRGVVVVLHDDGRRTTYEPVSPDVEVGETVEAGTRIGSVADGGDHCGGTCLHWGLLRGEDYLDPMSLLRHGRPVLLPPSVVRLP